MSEVGDYWDERYGEEEGFAFGEAPNAFLVSQSAYWQPGMAALAVGDGEGRNGVWLAEQGLSVVSVDAAQLGLDKAKDLAAQRGVRIETQCVDLEQWDWPVAQYDVVVAMYVHFPMAIRGRMHRAMLASLKPGGVLILEGFTKEQSEFQAQYDSGGPRDVNMLFSLDALREDFAEGVFLHARQRELVLDQGSFHQGLASVVSVVVRRPSV